MGAVRPALVPYRQCGDRDRERQGAALFSMKQVWWQTNVPQSVGEPTGGPDPFTAGWSASGARSISYTPGLPPRLVAPSASCRPGASLGRVTKM
jgi:hypothetical protein